MTHIRDFHLDLVASDPDPWRMLRGPDNKLELWSRQVTADNLHEAASQIDSLVSKLQNDITPQPQTQQIIKALAETARALAEWNPQKADDSAWGARLAAASVQFDEAFRSQQTVDNSGAKPPRPDDPFIRSVLSNWQGPPTSVGQWLVIDIIHRWFHPDMLAGAVRTVTTPVLTEQPGGGVYNLQVSLVEQSWGTGACIPDLFAIGGTEFPESSEWVEDLLASIADLWAWTGFGNKYVARWSLRCYPNSQTQWPDSLQGRSFEAAFLCALLALTGPDADPATSIEDWQLISTEAVTAKVNWPEGPPRPLSRDELLQLRVEGIGGLPVKLTAAQRHAINVSVATSQSGDLSSVTPLKTVADVLARLVAWERTWKRSIQQSWEGRWLNGTGNWMSVAESASPTAPERRGDHAGDAG